MLAPPLDQDLRFAERAERLRPQQLVAYVCSVTPIDRTASATALPCAASTSTCRSLATISSGVCAFFLPIHEPPFASAAHIAGGPLLGGQVRELVLDFDELGIALDNLEGMAFGPDLPDGRRTLVLVSDDNFSETQVTQFLAFGLDLERHGQSRPAGPVDAGVW